MIELTASAQMRLNDYLAELRRVLQECPSIDAVDVERDVQDHIQAALAGAETPVDETHLDRVLRSLGVPRDWVQDAARPWYRYPQQVGLEFRDLGVAFVRQFAGGPESFRLPYLSLAAVVLAVLMMASVRHDEDVAMFAILGGGVAFVLARAALTLHETRPSAGQMWILAPALLAVYLPLAGALLGWPILAGAVATAEIGSSYARASGYEHAVERYTANLAAIDEKIRLKTERQHEVGLTELSQERSTIAHNLDVARRNAAAYPLPPLPSYVRQVHPFWLAAFLSGAATGLWWLILGLLAWRRPGWFRALFRPFADNDRGRSGLLLSLAGAFLLGTGLVLCLA